jgi:predicted porin
MFKRALVAASVAAVFAAPAFADVTISGEIDAYIDYNIVGDAPDGSDRDADSITFNQESTIFFDGESKWDNGLTGIWHYGFTGEDGAIYNHSYWAGFKGDFGQVRFGKMLTPAFQQIDWYLSNNGNFIGEQMFTYNGSVYDFNESSSGGTGRRQNNQIRYDGTFGPVSVAGSVILNENAGEPGELGYSLAAQANFAPVNVYASYENNTSRRRSGGVGPTAWATEGGYTFGTLAADATFGNFGIGATYLYVSAEQDGVDAAGNVFNGAETEQDNWWIKGSYTAGKSTFFGSYGQAGEFDIEGEGAGLSTINAFGAGSYDQYIAQWRYALNKSMFFRLRYMYLDGGENGDVLGDQSRIRANLLYWF